MQQHLRSFIETSYVQTALITLILINAAILGMETSREITNSAGHALKIIDNIILTIFVFEIAIRLFVYRKSFWSDPWSVFDFSVVAIALVPGEWPFRGFAGVEGAACSALANHGSFHAQSGRCIANGHPWFRLHSLGAMHSLLRLCGDRD